MSEQISKETPTKTKPRMLFDSDKKGPDEFEREIKKNFEDLKTSNEGQGQLDNSLQMNLSERLDTSTKPGGGLNKKDADNDTTVNVLHQDLANKLDISFDSYPSSTKSGQMKGDFIPKETSGVPDKIITSNIKEGNRVGNLGDSRRKELIGGSNISSPNKAILAESTQYAHLKDIHILKKLFDSNEDDIAKAEQELLQSEKDAKDINARVKVKDNELKEFKANSWKDKQKIEQQVNDLKRQLEEQTYVAESLESKQKVIEHENTQLNQDLEPLKQELKLKADQLKETKLDINDVTREKRNIEIQLMVRSEECAKLQEKEKGFAVISNTLEKVLANLKESQENINDKEQNVNKLRERLDKEKAIFEAGAIDHSSVDLQTKLDEVREILRAEQKATDALRKIARAAEAQVASKENIRNKEKGTVREQLDKIAEKMSAVDLISRMIEEEKKELENGKREHGLIKDSLTRFERYREELRQKIDNDELRRAEVAKLLEGLLHEKEKFDEDRRRFEEERETELEEIAKIEAENKRIMRKMKMSKSGIGVIYGVLFMLLIHYALKYISQR